MRVSRNIIFAFVLLNLLLVGCSTPFSGAGSVTNEQLTPTMHTAFQLTPASERMPYPVPIEGVGLYENGGSGDRNREGATSGQESAAQQLVEGQVSEGGLIEGELANNSRTLVVNQVVIATPLPQPVSAARLAFNNGTASDDSQPLPTHTAIAPFVNSSASEQTEAANASEAATPSSICGGGNLNDAGPAPYFGGVPIDFEQFGVWTRTESTYGAFLLTSSLSKSGSQAAWVCYYFDSPENETAVFTQIHPVPGQPNTVRIWVNGNRSSHYLGVWIVDSQQETWHIPLGSISHEGWQEMEAVFNGPNAVPVKHISGPRNDRIDFPIKFRGIALNDVDDEIITYGSIVVDDVAFVTR